MENYIHLAPESEVTLFLDEPIVQANFGDRFLAAFIDGLILIIPNFLLQYMFGALGSLLGIVLFWLYSAIQESGAAQATIGKRAVNLQAVNEQGERLSFSQATGRHFGKYISGIILLIGYLMMLWDEKKQTLHDKMAGALIIKR